jgi:hypothetical protein
MKGGFRLAIHGRFNSDEGGAFGLIIHGRFNGTGSSCLSTTSAKGAV